MGRQNRRRVDEPRTRQGAGLSSQRTEEWRGEEYVVRALAGTNADKSYRCPGCDQIVAGSTPHLVVWPAYDSDATDRRHWHSTCWPARDRRAPGIQRSRSAPRF